MLDEPRADALGAEVAQHHPQLQRAEPAAELDAGVHQVPHRRRLGRRRYSGDEREGLAHDVHAAAEEHAEIERREQPLVRVDDERVGAARAVERCRATRAPSPSRPRRRRRRAARCLRVAQRSAIAATGSIAGGRRGADRGDDGDRDARRPRDRRRSPRRSAIGVASRKCRVRRNPADAPAVPGRAGSRPCRSTSARARSSRRASCGEVGPPAQSLACARRARPPRAPPPARAASTSTPCRR